jgi:dTDP-4-amino-4,6-dideoxygalactose transaminase
MLIGGVFGLEGPGDVPPGPARLDAPGFLREASLLTANARSAIRLLVAAVRPSSVWLPSYLCEALVRGVGPSQRIRWYPMDGRLRPSKLAWLSQVRPTDMVVAVDYFGFRAPIDMMEGARARGAFVLEDASQALLTMGAGDGADAVVFSPRKFVGVPDGGILQLDPRIELTCGPLAAAPEVWGRVTREAAMRRAEFDRGADDRGWYGLFGEAEATAPVGAYSMSEMSRRLLATAIDYGEVGRARRANFRTLAGLLPEQALLPDLHEGVVPLGFPIRIADRDRVRDALFAAEIYPPTHWPLEGVVPPTFAASHELARSILTLPCDQRYGPVEMARMAEAVLRAVAA